MSSDECKDCKAHSGMEESLQNIKEWQKGVTETIKHIVTAKAAWAFFIVFLTVCMAIVGFIWDGQTSIARKVEAGLKETMTGVNAINRKVDIIEYKVQEHIDDNKRK